MPDDLMRIEVAGENALIVYMGDTLSIPSFISATISYGNLRAMLTF